ncbi:hypothetical protein ACWGLG_06530 [Streptomyces antimycoticus]
MQVLGDAGALGQRGGLGLRLPGVLELGEQQLRALLVVACLPHADRHQGEDHAEQQLAGQVGHAAVRTGDRGGDQTCHEGAAEQCGLPSPQHEEGGQHGRRRRQDGHRTGLEDAEREPEPGDRQAERDAGEGLRDRPQPRGDGGRRQQGSRRGPE